MSQHAELFGPLKPSRRTLHEQIADSIEELVSTQKLGIGDRLPTVRELAQLLDVNRSTVTEALRLLQQRGLVEMRVGDGTYVMNVPDSAVTKSLQRYLTFGNYDADDLYTLRRVLEPEVAALAAQAATADDLALVRQIVEQFNDPAIRGKLDDEITVDIAFHQAVVHATHNSLLIAIMNALHRFIETTMRQDATPWGGAYASHWPIYEAIAARDAPRARDDALPFSHAGRGGASGGKPLTCVLAKEVTRRIKSILE